MKAIMVMFDSLNRNYLPNYSCTNVAAPNFERLGKCAVTYDNFYVGSMPCIPARRELHTGRYNFLHRSWCPIEPYDDSMPQMLKNSRIYTHITSDHVHYWLPGGFGYLNKYSSFETSRGQSGDPWKGNVKDPLMPLMVNTDLGAQNHRQDWVNRKYIKKEQDFPIAKTFAAGLEFIEENKDEDNWYLQIETFAPHEPFFSPEKYKKLYPHKYNSKHFDWPDYYFVTETEEEVEHMKNEYRAIVSMCDEYIGKVLDLMDANNMWKDTMLIVNSDHGFLLGEHDWWGKLVQPMYNEIAKIPFFMWNPKENKKNVRADGLFQTIDIPVTLLDYFGVQKTEDMLGQKIAVSEKGHDAVLFGYFGSHVYCSDGQYVYMRGPQKLENTPSAQYGIIPADVMGVFPLEVIRKAEHSKEFSYSKDIRLMSYPQKTMFCPSAFETTLYKYDGSTSMICDDIRQEQRMAQIMRGLMLDNDAPDIQFDRLGLKKNGTITQEEILQHHSVYKSTEYTLNNITVVFEDGVKKAYMAARHALTTEQQSELDENLLSFSDQGKIIITKEMIIRFMLQYPPAHRRNFLTRMTKMSLKGY